jgi:uncharacterized protein (DUF1684 family)
MSESALDLLDWRRRVADLYRRVRALLPDEPVAAHTLWLDARTRLFRSHPQSPLPADGRATFRRIRSWPYNPQLRFEAPVRLLPEERIAGPRSDGNGEFALVRFGAVDLPLGTLDVFWVDDYGGGLFLPFRDATCGETTYGGGRYLIDTAKGADLGSTSSGDLLLDFNFAYHPSCAWNSRWACPLAPPQNSLDVAIEAGEQLPPH